MPVKPATPTLQPLPDEIILYDWPGDMPDRVVQAFTQEYGVQVRYKTYESQEEAVESIQQGELYDVVVIDNRLIPQLISTDKLAALHRENIPNLSNIGAEFRGRAFDLENRFSVPFNWGTVGLVVRSDLMKTPVTRWSDLRHMQEIGKVVMWKTNPREMMGAALKSLGYSANSENRAELEQVLQHLNELRANLVFGEAYGDDLETSAPLLTLDNAVLAVGWSYDALEAQEDVSAVSYVIPSEGGLLWGDNFVIPANAPNAYAAEVFLNFLLRPEISALISEENGYATANKQSSSYISPEIFENPYIFPPLDVVSNCELILALSPEGDALHQEIWSRFIDQP